MAPPTYATLGFLVAITCGSSAAAGDRDQALKMLASLTLPPSAPPQARAKLEQARAALKQSDQARPLGKHQEAALLETHAKELVECSRDLLLATRYEQKAQEAQVQAGQLATRIARLKLNIEAAEVRRERAHAQWKRYQDALRASQPSPPGGTAKNGSKSPGAPKATPLNAKGSEH